MITGRNITLRYRQENKLKAEGCYVITGWDRGVLISFISQYDLLIGMTAKTALILFCHICELFSEFL